MAFTPDSNRLLTSGATPVDLVPAPSSGTKRMVKSVTVYNADTAVATITIQVNDGTVWVQKKEASVAVGARVTLDSGEVIVLDSSDKVQVVLAGVVTTNELQCSASWADIS